VLALVGGLAAACFAKVVGVVFLGSPRSDAAARAHEAPRAMRVPMAFLAAACAAIGLAPALLVAPLRDAAAGWAQLDPEALAGPASRAFQGAARVSLVAAFLVAIAALAALARRRYLAHPTAVSPTPTWTPAATGVETWGCGFAAPTARMQYTGSSFAELLLRRFTWTMRSRGPRPRLGGPFPRPGEHAFATEVPDTVLDLALLPAARGFGWIATQARLLYLRRIQFQMLLVVLALLAFLAWGFAW
jgi:NADH:ubiquinone oxidoreductase subunit 5 (subunit L)/multisubunit Na+/H+ antiporter MnhA subunit